MIPCISACGGSSRTCKFPMRGNVRKTRVLMRECKSAISANETFSFGLTRIRSLRNRAAAGTGAEFTFCVVSTLPPRRSPIASEQSQKASPRGIVLVFRNAQSEMTARQFVFIVCSPVDDWPYKHLTNVLQIIQTSPTRRLLDNSQLPLNSRVMNVKCDG